MGVSDYSFFFLLFFFLAETVFVAPISRRVFPNWLQLRINRLQPGNCRGSYRHFLFFFFFAAAETAHSTIEDDVERHVILFFFLQVGGGRRETTSTIEYR